MVRRQPIADVTVYRDSPATWAVSVEARPVLSQESHTVAANVAECLRTGWYDTSECAEVAAAIYDRLILEQEPRP